MTKLQTLKDLKREENNGPASMGGMDIVEYEELRAEAINWYYYWHKRGQDITCAFIRTFFNLTKEDLK